MPVSCANNLILSDLTATAKQLFTARQCMPTIHRRKFTAQQCMPTIQRHKFTAQWRRFRAFRQFRYLAVAHNNLTTN